MHKQKQADNGRKGYFTQDDRRAECLCRFIVCHQQKQAEQNEKLQERIKELTARVAWLNRQLFGRKSEKLRVYDSNMPDLFADEFSGARQLAEEKRDEAVEKIEKESAEVRKQNRWNRK